MKCPARISLFLFLALAASSAAAQTKPTLLYHGYVTNSSNVPVSGSFAMTFTLHDSATGGNEVWMEVQSATIANGNLAVELGKTTDLTSDLFAGQPLYLGVKIGQEEMPNRQVVASVPLALLAQDTKGLAGKPIISAGCTDGQVLTFGAAGWTCAAGGGGNFTAGPGIKIAGTVISLIDTCTVGQVLKWDGTAWVCMPDDLGPTFTAGSGLELMGNSFSLIASCSAGQVLKWNGTAWACAADDNAGQTYQAGSGIELGAGNTFSLLGSCATDQVLKWNGTTWGCAADVGGTAYGVATGGGLALTGTNFGLVSCPQDQVLKSDGSTWSCGAQPSFAGVDGGGVTVSGGNIQLITCNPGEVLKFNAGAWGCGPDAIGENLTPGDGLTLSGTSLALKTCALNQFLSHNGTSWQCVSTWQGTTISIASGGTGATTAAAARTNLGAAQSGANSDITALSGLTTAITVPQGGTGGTTAAAARTNLGAAQSGANSDITALSGLTTAITVPQGGTGATNAAGARTNLGAAQSGANSDITALSGLTTAITVGQGGTGAITAAGARSNLMCAQSGTNTDITSLGGLTTAITVAQGGTGATTASGARDNLLCAARGANSDITQLTGLTTALSVSQGGTGTTSTLSGVVLGGSTSFTSIAATGPQQYLRRNLTNDGYQFVSQSGSGGPVGSARSISTDSTLTGGGDLTSDRTLGINLNNSNTWTAAQSFSSDVNFPGGGRWRSTGGLGIGTTSEEATLSIGSTSNVVRTIGVERNTLADTAGTPLTIFAGGASLGATNKAGGDLRLNSGVPTGAGSSKIELGTYAGVSPGTSDAPFSVKMTITGGGNVGIGTGAPASTLHVVGSARITNLASCDVVSTNASGTLSCGTDSVNDPDAVVGNEVTGATNTTLTRSGSGTAASQYTLGLNLGNANTWTAAQSFSGGAFFPGSGVWGGGGFVGIGTTSPTASLAFGGEVSRLMGVERRTTADSPGNLLTIRAGGASVGATNKGGGTLNLHSGTSTGNAGSEIQFATASPGAAGTADRTPTTKMIIASDGDVGIGTTSPSQKLHVVGNARITGLASCSAVSTDASGNLSCGSVNDADAVVGNEVTGATNATLTRSGSGTAASQYTLGLNLGNANSWTAAQTFSAGASFPGSGIWNASGNVGIATTSPTATIGLGGEAPRTIQVERIQTSNQSGRGLVIRAGGATVGATDKIGGNLLLEAGLSTGTGGSRVEFYTATPGTAGTADRSPSLKMALDGDGNLGVGVSQPSTKLHVVGNARITGLVSCDTINTDASGNLSCGTDAVDDADSVVGNEVTDAADSTLTRSGSGTAAAPYKLGLNLGNPNTWTGAQTFSANTTTALVNNIKLARVAFSDTPTDGDVVAATGVGRLVRTTSNTVFRLERTNFSLFTEFVINVNGARTTGSLSGTSCAAPPPNCSAVASSSCCTVDVGTGTPAELRIFFGRGATQTFADVSIARFFNSWVGYVISSFDQPGS